MNIYEILPAWVEARKGYADLPPRDTSMTCPLVNENASIILMGELNLPYTKPNGRPHPYEAARQITKEVFDGLKEG